MTERSVSASEALARLRDGNRRFIGGGLDLQARVEETRRAELATRQRPFAIVLGCSDSRVPVELIFDQGLGDLFVIRVAGNIVAPSLVGSVEFAAVQFGTRLVVVLGHTGCGAVTAAIEATREGADHSPNIRSVVDWIRPSIETLLASGPAAGDEELVEQAVRANVRASADHLRHGSAILEELIRDGGLRVVGAEYSLETGAVDFFDGVEDVG